MATITGTDAGESIQGTLGDDVIYGLGGDDVLDGDDGSDILHGGDGNDELREVSSGTQVEHHQMFGDAGDDVLALDLRSSYADTVLLDGGTGNDRITFEAWYTLQALTIDGGDGDDFVRIVGGRDVSVDGGSGADRIELAYSDTTASYRFSLGAGADILELNRVSTLTSIGAPIHITDFEAGAAGDRIILDRLLGSLTGWDRITNPFASGHLALVQRGADAVLQIDLGGGLRDFFVLEGLSATALTDRNLGLAPGGGAASPITADGGTGADWLDGSGGADLLRGFDGADQLFGGLGNDRLEGGLGADTLEGGFGDDVLLGEQGNDTLRDYDAGDDQLLGGDGNDSLEVIRSYREPAGTIVLDGGTGDDTLRFGTSPYFQRRAKIDHVTVIGGDGNDDIRVRGAGVADVDAGAGADQVNVGIDGTVNLVSLGSGADTLTLGAEATREIVAVVVRDFEAGNGGDRLDLQNYLQYALTGWNPLNNPFEYGYLQRVQRGADAVLQIDVDGAAGPAAMTDLVIFRNVASSSLTTFNLGGYATFTGTEGNDLIEGDSGNNTLRGLGGNDTLNGYDGDDFLDGGAGDDVMTGGNGSDVYIVTDAGDQVIEASDSAWTSVDEVRTSLPVYAMPAYVERLVGTSDAGQTLTSQGGSIFGGGGNDVIDVGNGSGAALGGAGDDLIKGGTGNDQLQGGVGSDTLYGYDGNDFLNAGGGAPYAAGNDYLDGGDGNDTLWGSVGNDVLIGGIGNDNLYDDMSGNDLFDAGDGDDTLLLSRYSYGPVTVGTVSLLGGAGNDAISLVVDNASTVIVDGGTGNDTVDFYNFAGIATVTLGTGADVIGFSDYMPSVNPNGRITVTDFDLGPGGDSLSWTGFLQGWLLGWDQAVNPFLSGHVRLGRSGTATVLQLDRDGHGDGFATLLTFQDTDAAGFTAAHLGYAPLGDIALVGSPGNDTMAGSAANDIMDGGAGDDIIEGLGGDDRLTGGDGKDTLNGGIGADTMIGGNGDDIYYVDNAGDSIVEAFGQGRDSVFVTTSFALAAYAEIELFAVQDRATTGALTLTGSLSNNAIYGNMGANGLIGGGGSDTLYGLGGDDAYIVDDASDMVIEYAGQGRDTVYALGSYALVSISEVEVLTAYDRSGTAAINLTGSATNNVLYGNMGANGLIGGGGTDTLYGLGGDDAYIVDDASDVVIEYAGQGRDTVYALGSYALASSSEVEVLTTYDRASTAAVNLTGSATNNVLYGNMGANGLIGGGGTDTLYGLGGDDAYIVDDASDVVIEYAGQGRDTVYALGSYALVSSSEVEVLTTYDRASTAAVSLTGSASNNVLYGNTGANGLIGGGGSDTLYGLGGDDAYIVDDASDVVIEFAGQGWDTVYATGNFALAAGSEVEVLTAYDRQAGGAQTLTGNALANRIYGNAGVNVLDGKGGADILYGLGGADTFQFTTIVQPGMAPTLIGDFASGQDRIALDDAVFGALAVGALSAAAFATGSAAADADDRIVYDPITGAVWYDPDGTGAAAAIHFATLQSHPTLTAADFLIL